MTDTAAQPEVKAISLEPPKLSSRGKAAVHTPEQIKSIAESAAKGWTSNNRTYKTKSGAQGACQTVKEAIVSQKLASKTADLTARVWQLPDGAWVFAIAAKKVVTESQ